VEVVVGGEVVHSAKFLYVGYGVRMPVNDIQPNQTSRSGNQFNEVVASLSKTKKSAPRRAMRKVEDLLTFVEEAGPISPGQVVYMDALELLLGGDPLRCTLHVSCWYLTGVCIG